MSVSTNQIPLKVAKHRKRRPVFPLSLHLLITDGRGYPFVRERAWFIEEQGTVYLGCHILLVDRKISQMPSMSLSCGFARLFTAAEPENRSAQNNRQLQE
jgi:hypothetical protein